MYIDYAIMNAIDCDSGMIKNIVSQFTFIQLKIDRLGRVPVVDPLESFIL